MRTKKIWFAAIILFIFVIVICLWMIFMPHGQTVNIIQNGDILYTIDLEKADDRTIVVEYKNSKNVIQIRNHHICIIEAECPDKTCIKMGELKSAAAPIICLPNKLVIEFADSDNIDAKVK